MTVSNRLKERFCKDCNLPIKIFDEPYFMDRLNLLDPAYNCMFEFDRFVSAYERTGYDNEEEYFADYNRVKDYAINYIKETDAYNEFITRDMSEFSVNSKFPSTDIYKAVNTGRRFISIDMKKANFSALRNYSSKIFDGCDTWEMFINKFTNNQHIINSKYIRQVILGNCCPKRHINYEKSIMYHLLNGMLQSFGLDDKAVVFFSNDEIVFDGNSIANYTEEIAKYVADFTSATTIPFRITDFVLHSIGGTQGYYKDITNSASSHSYEFKCLNSYEVPFVIRKATGQLPNDLDRYFIAEGGRLASFVDAIDVDIPILYTDVICR